MMGRLMQSAAAAFTYFCVATVLTEAILAVVIVSKWQLDRTRVAQMLAIASGVDLFAFRTEAEKERDQPPAEQPSYDQVLEARAAKMRNLELREQALQDELAQLRLAQEKTADEQKRYKQVKESFDAALRAQSEGAAANGTEEVRRIIEAVKPKQAKDLLVQMLDEKKLDEVVVLLAAMPDAKRAKIIGEFKTAEDKQRIGQVLDRIAAGVPAADIADQTRKQLAPPKPGPR
jgi:hypothetical protein